MRIGRVLRLVAFVLIAAGVLAGLAGEWRATAAETTPPNAAKPESPTASSSPTIVGWRGNGTGRFPNSNIPVTWGRVSKLMAGVRTQAGRPEGDKAGGVAAYNGQIPAWLVLGPYTPADPNKAMSEAFIPEADVRPEAGEKVADKAWTLAATEGHLLDFAPHFRDAPPGQVAYAHSYIYSAQSGTVMLRFLADNAAGIKAWVNGKVVSPAYKSFYNFSAKVPLLQGWNRVLVKVCRGGVPNLACGEFYHSQWKFVSFFHALAPYEWESKNIVWSTKLPWWSAACPIVVGDKLFVMSERSDLVCLNKKDGRILWIRSNTYYDAVSPEERKADPAFGEMAPLMARLKIINDAWCTPAGPTKQMIAEKLELEDKVLKLTRKLNHEKYNLPNPNSMHAGYCLATPCSDGKHVYAWPGSGVAACYDLEGNRQWIALPPDQRLDMAVEHCYPSSPTLAGGNFIATMQPTIALDARAGKEVWRNSDCVKHANSRIMASLLPFRIQGQDMVFARNMIFRATDGKVLWCDKEWEGYGNIITPVLQDGWVYAFYTMDPYMLIGKLPEATGEKLALSDISKIKVTSGDAYNKRMYCAAPLVHEGLAYLIDMVGRLKVIDIQTKSLVYEKYLFQPEVGSHYHGIGSFYACPILAGKYIYLFNGTGATLVIEPGRVFKPVAVNVLENDLYPDQWFEGPEHFAASPVCDGNRLYIRGDDSLYCIGQE